MAMTEDKSPARHERRPLWGLIVLVLIGGLGALLVWGFVEGRGEATAEAQREQPVKAAVQVTRTDGASQTITLSPDLQREADIAVKQPNAVPYQRQMQGYGSVLDLQSFTDLSNTIATAKGQLAVAQAKLNASQAAFERARVLHDKGQASTAQFQSAEATYQSDEAGAQAARVQTQNASASAYQAWGPVLGRSLAEGTTLAGSLIQRRKVLVQVTLPVGVALAKAPTMASIETTTGQRVGIEYVSAATRTDPKIQGVSFFYTADAASGALPGMNVIALLPVGQPTPGMAIPGTAVVWLQGNAWVYLQTAANTFTRREIPTGLPAANGGYVVPVLPTMLRPEPDAPASDADSAAQGFPTNEPLVVTGAQALLSQEFSAQIQVGGD
ncbi:MAG: multidrug transporter [Rhizobiaceae bacterium]|nr:MAG: multidrug transporter [Rhizobiaceae bacterium]